MDNEIPNKKVNANKGTSSDADLAAESDQTQIYPEPNSEGKNREEKTKTHIKQGNTPQTSSSALNEERTKVLPISEPTKIYQSDQTLLQQNTEIPKKQETESLTSDASDATRIYQKPEDVSNQATKVKTIFAGQIINNRFVLENKLGEGGMGEVFLAKDMRRIEFGDQDPYVVLKFLHEEFYTDTRFIRALQRESKKTQRLSHPNIITVYDFDRDSNLAYISMEYLQGESLYTVIAKNNRPLKKLLYIIERMARGLAYAHQEGFVHADFKPANVFVTKDEFVKVLDFGIAQAVIEEKGHYRSDILSNQQDLEIIGITPHYASPQVLAKQMSLPVDDVYSFCCVAYELLTGHLPWRDIKGKPVDAQKAMELKLEAAALKGIPSGFAKAILKGLSFNREDRFTHAGEFLDAIKPRFTKVQIGLASSFALIAMMLYFVTDTWLDNKIPSLSSFGSKLGSVTKIIKEADDILELGDIDFAHRLYAQAWDESRLLDLSNISEEKLKRVIDHRMNSVAKNIIDEIDDAESESNLFRLQELELALGYLKRDTLGSYDEQIEEELIKLKKKIKKLEDKTH